MSLPNETTLKAMEDIEKGRNVKKFETTEELFEDLGLPSS
jgi:antitoxin component of RelBE/YafQ-DinJ toxin-antitoxin module